MNRKLGKWFVLGLVLFISLGVAACGGGGGGGAASAKPTYTMTYDGNGNTGGSAPTDASLYESGQIVTVLGNTGSLVKTGYSFTGWSTQADGSGTSYTQAQTFSMGSANVILFAKWTANPTYTVTYSGNGNTGGSVPIDSTNYEQGQTVTVLANTGTLVKSGYTFAGWNTQANGSGMTYTQSQTLTMGSANITLYAKWTANLTYTVTYNGNGNIGGNVPTDSTNYEQGQVVTVLGNSGNLTKNGYTFAGWNTQADGNGTTYAQAQTFTMDSANVTLYAKWTANPTYTVTYNGNGNTGGTVPIDTTNYEQGQIVTVLGNTDNLVRSGYIFEGWNTQADGSGTTYAQGQTFAMGTANITLYANWTIANTYTITYDGNGNTGGSVPTDAGQYAEGQNVTVLRNTGQLVHSGYTLAGWNTQANGSGTGYCGGSTFIMGTANVTLYAQWVVPSNGVVISQIYGAGALTGATYASDFVELFNPTASSVSMSCWTLQYGSALNNFSVRVSDIPSGTQIQAGHYFLIQLHTGYTGVPLPTPDLVKSTDISGSNGKLALVNEETMLTCGAAGNHCTSPSIVDFVGYGSTATDYDGTGPAPSGDATRSIFRNGGGCIDTDDNRSDFVIGAVSPRNSASAAILCQSTCAPGETTLCPNQIGVCSGSVMTCLSDGTWPADCDYTALPAYSTTEICDGLDNNCNGVTDEQCL